MKVSVSRAADYLCRQLDRIAQDPHQDFPLFTREMTACLARVEAALSVAVRREVGAPCPKCAAIVHETLPCCADLEQRDLTVSECDGVMELAHTGLEYVCHTCASRCGSQVHPQHAGPKAPRLVLHRADHDVTGARDEWRCPAQSKHRFTEAEYRLRISEDYLANAHSLTAPDMRRQYRVPEGSVRGWAAKRGEDGKPLVRKRGRDDSGRQLYDVADVVAVRDGERRAMKETA